MMKTFGPRCQRAALPGLAVLILGASPLLASAQESGTPGDSLPGSLSLAAPTESPAGSLAGAAERSPALAPEFSSRELGLHLLQDEVGPLRLALSVYGRVDVPGDTSVTQEGVAYSDVFDIGYGANVELSLLSQLTPHWSTGGYISIGWDRFVGASNVDMGTGEFENFDNQDVITAIVGGKILHRFGPAWFWEGRMGVGLVHYGALTFTDVTTPVTVPGLQFFRPITHGLFDLGTRVGFGNPRMTFDIGLDFRFMGSEARGRDVTSDVDPDFFFVFAIDLGLTFRF